MIEFLLGVFTGICLAVIFAIWRDEKRNRK